MVRRTGRGVVVRPLAVFLLTVCPPTTPTASRSPIRSATVAPTICQLMIPPTTCPTAFFLLTPRPTVVFALTAPPTTCPLLILSMTCPLLLTVKACRLWCASTWSGCVVRR